MCICAPFQLPVSTEEWNSIADEFNTRWNFPNCLGAIDKKLVHVQRPVTAGSQYFNYKRSFSVNMMALVDARYRFLFVAVGAQGSANDAAVYDASALADAIANPENPLNIPPPRALPGTSVETPMLFVVDEAYPLKPYLMKPFSSRGLGASERIYNYRLSRARRVVENAFGILVNRFRILTGRMQLQPNVVCDVVMACCALHNFFRTKAADASTAAEDDLDEDSDLTTVDFVTHETRLAGANYNAASKLVRDKLAAYFVGPGQVQWQWKHGNIAVREE